MLGQSEMPEILSPYSQSSAKCELSLKKVSSSSDFKKVFKSINQFAYMLFTPFPDGQE